MNERGQKTQPQSAVAQWIDDLREKYRPPLDRAAEGFEKFMGPSGMAFLRQGLAELRELGNPGLDGSVAQPTGIGVLGHPPSGIVTQAMTDKDQTFSMDQIRGIGKDATQQQDATQAHDASRDDQGHGR